MKCDKAQEFFSDYIETALDRPMTVALESHLSGCESCRADVASLRSMWTVLDQVPQVEPPADFVWRTTTRLQHEVLNRKEAERARPLPWWKRLTPVQSFSYAGIAALLAVGLFVPTFKTPVGDRVGVWGLLFNQRAPEPPQFLVQVGPEGGATVSIRAMSELPKARVWMGYLTPTSGAELKGREYPFTAPQTLPADQTIQVPIQAGGAKAARITLYVDNRPLSKILLLPGAPVVNVSIREGDPYFALQQVVARTNQPMLVDANLGRVTVDFTTLTPDQARDQILRQTGAQAVAQQNGVLTITNTKQ